MTTEFWAQRGSVLWQTDPEIVDRAREALGGYISLDPCAGAGTAIGEVANFRLPAENGLEADWDVENRVDPDTSRGRTTTVFINPPFGVSWVHPDGRCIAQKQYTQMVRHDPALGVGWVRQTSQQWAKKVSRAGLATVWLSKGSMETTALRQVLHTSAAVCHPKRRVAYIDPDTRTKVQGATFASVLVYQGPDPGRFARAFGDLGAVLVPYPLAA